MSVRRRWMLFSIAAAILLASCAQSQVASSTSRIFDLHRQYLKTKEDWVKADQEAILTLCAVARSINRREYTDNVKTWENAVASNPTDENISQQNEAQQRLTDLDGRIKQCTELPPPSDLATAGDAADSAGSGSMWESAQETATKAVVESISLVNSFPTSSIRGMSYNDQTTSTLQEKRSSILKQVADITSNALDVAKSASGAALSSASTAQHELDREFAKESDDSYTTAATALAAMSNLNDAGGGTIFGAADQVLSRADSAVAYAQHETGKLTAQINSEGGQIATASFAPLSTPGPNDVQSSTSGAPSVSEANATAASGCITVVADPNPPANVRAAPGGAVIGNLNNGTQVSAVKGANGWLHISSPVNGWIFASLTTQQCANSQQQTQDGPAGADIVQQYYRLWNHKNYPAMYAMLSSSYQVAHPYSAWLTQHEGTESILVDTTPAGGSNVSVVVHSTDRAANGSLSHSTYQGTWNLTIENGAWRLDSASLQQV